MEEYTTGNRPSGGRVRAASVVLADELVLLREGLAALCRLDVRYSVVGQCEDGLAALAMIESLLPDIAILDLNLPKLFTLEVLRRLRLAGSRTRSVVLSLRSDRKSVMEALRSGAHAFVLKTSEPRYLFEALEQVTGGGIYLCPALDMDILFGNGQPPSSDDPLLSLSAREYQVFCLLVEGLRAKEVAARLDLSAKTVDTYRASLMRKLDIHDVAGLVKFAIRRNLTNVR